jgi:hypothetical protein
MRNLVSIKTITNLEPIPDADRIVKATIDGGWPVVVKKDEFKIDDKCIYFEIDSIVPTDDPRFKFLEKESKIYNGLKGARIRSIKLKKTLSQGLALPIKEFEKELKEKDLTTAIKVQKWIPPEEMEIEPVVKSSSWRDFLLKCLPVSLRKKAYSYLYPKTSGTFPKWLKKTDQERCVSGDTLVITNNGEKKIKDLNSSDSLISSYDIVTQQECMAKITNIMSKNMEKHWLKLITESGKEIICTTDHRIFMPDLKVFRLASDLQIGDAIGKTDQN